MYLSNVFLVMVISVAVVQNSTISVGNGKEINDTTVQKGCVCVNWRFCNGEINSDVECHPNYVMVCCIQPALEEVHPSEEVHLIHIP
ncbi:hypothetical protein JTB14_018807 [Gonioctena quinquepunctata]|nr:hypothetical protein JTB14_018807 [Gonioctena quinquepunctata]